MAGLTGMAQKRGVRFGLSSWVHCLHPFCHSKDRLSPLNLCRS